MESKVMRNKLDQRDYHIATLRAYLLQSGFNYGNYQGIGYANIIRPGLEKIYGDDKEALKKALLNNVDFYNTNPQLVPFVSNLHLVMEESGIETDQIKNMKMALMGPLAGIGDSLSQFLIAPLLSTIFASMAAEGNPLGPILFFVVINTILLAIKFAVGSAGKKAGMAMIDKLSTQMEKVTTAASIVGVTVISALSTNLVKIFIPFTYTKQLGEETQVVAIQKMVDGIAPKLLAVGYTALVYYLVKKKKWSTYKVIILTILIAIIGSVLGVISPKSPV